MPNYHCSKCGDKLDYDDGGYRLLNCGRCRRTTKFIREDIYLKQKQEEEAQKQREEAERREAARKEAERKEAERKEAERKEAARKEAERKEAARKEAERKEAARKEAETRKEAARKEAERREAERKEAERKEKECVGLVEQLWKGICGDSCAMDPVEKAFLTAVDGVGCCKTLTAFERQTDSMAQEIKILNDMASLETLRVQLAEASSRLEQTRNEGSESSMDLELEVAALRVKLRNTSNAKQEEIERALQTSSEGIGPLQAMAAEIQQQVDEEGVSRLDAQQKAEECLLRHNEEAARLQLLQERIACLERIMATVRSDAEACAERLTQAGHQKALLQHNAGVRDRVVQGGHAALQQFRQALATRERIDADLRQLLPQATEYKDHSTRMSPTRTTNAAPVAQPSATQVTNNQPPAAADSADRTFEGSNFKREYDAAAVPEYQHQLLSAVKELVDHHCAKNGIDEEHGKSFFRRLQSDAFQKPGELLSEVPTAAQRLWTSPQPMSERHDFGLHAIINSAIREDDPEEAPAAAVISRALNSLLVFRRPPVELHFPPEATVWRGGGLPDAHRAFYTAGKMYRVPGFLATSFSEDKAYEFMYRAHALHGLPAVQWVVHLDPRGQQQFRYRCKQVNFVNATQVPGEEEFLFAAYSVFTVRDVQWVSEATPDGPHVVHLEAAIDNNLPNSGGLPLAPWY
uniref:Uncharacterized protein n=1 Tax=Eutreptiella gymnastica TaxID=73025 RepID=A0A7S4G9F7_9EUGL